MDNIVFNDKEIIYKNSISPEDIKVLLNFKDYPHPCGFVEGEGGMYINHK